ncbi:ABC transporter ATP-binding protein [Cytobacillus kochii]
MTQLIFEHISKSYHSGEPVIKDFHFETKEQEFIVFVGPSGCGKSTILKMIAGLENITSGRLIIDGKEMNNVPTRERNLSMVFQNYALYPHMTVYQNIAFGLKMRKEKKTDIKKKVLKAAEITGLTGLLTRKPTDLSGGQRQRVALARAIVCDNPVFLMDEPLSNLDAKLRTQMRREITLLHKRLATTTIYVTHDQTEAMTMADRIIVLKDGSIQQVGTPHEIYETPANLFVASFIGSPAINVLEGKVESNVITIDGIPTHFSRKNLKTTNEALIGVRPEHLIIDEYNPLLTATVEDLETLGADTIIYAKHNRIHLTIKAPGLLSFSKGDPLPLSLTGEHLLLFDKESKKVIL